MPSVPLCFELIKSLDKTEKIHFKRYLSYQSEKGEPTNYLKLFNELDKMPQYDAERLRRKFAKEKFMKHLPVSLNYLNSLLLSSLVNYHTKKQDYFLAEAMLGEIRVLFQKKLYRHCERQIKRARKFMEEREFLLHLYTLGAYEYNLVARQMQKDEISDLNRITKERRSLLKKLDEELVVFSLNNTINQYVREKQLNPNRDFTKETEVIENELEQLKPAFETGRTTFKLFYTLSVDRLFYLKDQPVESLRTAHQYLSIKLNLPKNLRYNDEADLSSLINHLSNANQLWFVDEIKYWLPHFDIIKKRASGLTHRSNLLKYHFTFQVLLLEGAFDSLKNLIGQLMKELDVLLNNNVAYFQFLMFENLAMYHFLNGNYHESLQWIDRIYKQKTTDNWIQQNVLKTRIIEMMAHFNLGNYQLISSLALSFERFIKKLTNGAYEFVEELNWTRKMKRIDNYNLPKQMKALMETLLLQNYFSIPINDCLVLIDVWTKAHQNNISLKFIWQKVVVDVLDEMKLNANMKELSFEPKW